MKFLSSSVLLLLVVVGTASAFTTSDTASNKASAIQSTTITTTTKLEASSKREEITSTKSRFNPSDWIQARGNKKQKCGPCPDDDDNNDDVTTTLENLFSSKKNTEDGTSTVLNNNNNNVDRREAAFAMLGSLWAVTTTTAFEPANAVYGADAKIEMPNVMQGLNDRATKQCLVESLGNRECLVYMDPDNQLYKGANTAKLLEKIDKSSLALTKIPELVETRKWMGIQSILTGPMGELMSTMNLLAPLSTQQPDKSTTLAKKAKLQIFAIGAAVDKRDGAAVLKSCDSATQALVAFVESL